MRQISALLDRWRADLVKSYSGLPQVRTQAGEYACESALNGRSFTVYQRYITEKKC